MTPAQDQNPERIGPVNTWLDSQHMILGNVELPVRFENAPELPRPDNITREGRDEEGMSSSPIRMFYHSGLDFKWGMDWS